MAGQYGSPAYASHNNVPSSAVTSPRTTDGYGSTPGINSSTTEVSNTTTPPMARQFGSPYDVVQHNPQRQIAAGHNTTNHHELIPGTDSIITPLPPPSLAQHNQAISNLLERGTKPTDILRYVEIFKHMVWSHNFNGLAFTAWYGNFHDLAILAAMPTEELAWKVQGVVNTPSHPIVEPRSKAKRESLDVDTGSPPQGAKRPRASRKGKDAAPAIPKRTGCPGNNWLCKPDELEQGPRKYWDTRKKFDVHFDANHLENCRVNGHRWQCPLLLCDRPSFGGDGSQLKDHLWDDHLV